MEKRHRSGLGCDGSRSGPGHDSAGSTRVGQIVRQDSHFSVREWAWISVRPFVACELIASLSMLGEWCDDSSSYVRRFASEVTRPRGVWCKHIVQLKESPEVGVNLLDRLRSDESHYVQLSVGNWLNDASKSRPDWVRLTCDRWLMDETPSTRRICERGLRSIKKLELQSRQ